MTKPAIPTSYAAEDARRLKPDAQHAKRNQVIALYVRGISRSEIVEQSGMSDTAVARIIKLYKAGGEAALEPQTRGRRIQLKPKNDLAQTIQNFICGDIGPSRKLKS